jgi:hypothetical protein
VFRQANQQCSPLALPLRYACLSVRPQRRATGLVRRRSAFFLAAVIGDVKPERCRGGAGGGSRDPHAPQSRIPRHEARIQENHRQFTGRSRESFPSWPVALIASRYGPQAWGPAGSPCLRALPSSPGLSPGSGAR